MGFRIHYTKYSVYGSHIVTSKYLIQTHTQVVSVQVLYVHVQFHPALNTVVIINNNTNQN